MFGEGTTTTASSELANNRNPFATALPRSIQTNFPESDGLKTNPSAATPDDGSEGVGSLEWAQVIELQEFSDRKVWIEEKTRVNTILHFSKVFPTGYTQS
jgi:hypothetical protein